jgi:galactokinase
VLAKSSDPEFPAESLVRRFDQFLLESEEIIPRAVASLKLGELKRFGELVTQSQAAAELGLENQVPETKALVRTARDLGAHAASAFGAGFGGSVWALVDREEAEAFATEWRAMYLRQFATHARRCRFFATGAGPGLVNFQ